MDGASWAFDIDSFMKDFPTPGGDDLGAPGAIWSPPPPPPPAFTTTSPLSSNLNDSFGNSDTLQESGSKKRARQESCNAPRSKACREKMRRDKLNDRFLELSELLDPGRTPKVDKCAILSDAVHMVTQLRDETETLKETNKSLQQKMSDLKVEKNELRDEKQRLKAEKETLEQQVRALSSPASFMAPPPAFSVPFSAPGQVIGSKLVPFVGYPGVPMWQFMQPAQVDTSEDPALRSVAA